MSDRLKDHPRYPWVFAFLDRKDLSDYRSSLYKIGRSNSS